jgi:hypothetical protein
MNMSLEFKDIPKDVVAQARVVVDKRTEKISKYTSRFPVPGYEPASEQEEAAYIVEMIRLLDRIKVLQAESVSKDNKLCRQREANKNMQENLEDSLANLKKMGAKVEKLEVQNLVLEGQQRCTTQVFVQGDSAAVIKGLNRDIYNLQLKLDEEARKTAQAETNNSNLRVRIKKESDVKHRLIDAVSRLHGRIKELEDAAQTAKTKLLDYFETAKVN